MALSDFIPGVRNTAPIEESKAQDVMSGTSGMMKLFKPSFAAVASEKMSISGFTSRRANFEASPYDFDRIIKAIDSDSYAQQAFSKYRELIWKESWEIVSKNDQAVEYLWKRIRLFEVAMNRSFYDFLVEVADQLVKFNNVFIAKSRGELQSFFPGKLYVEEDKQPIVGYYVLPTEKIEIQRDKHNNVIKYRQRIDDVYAAQPSEPSWPADEVIHLKRNCKPGRVFGSPFITPALDDIISLRQLEEDILNLMHRELFPLYFYRVGTDTFPADQSAIDDAYRQLDTLRTEGGIIAPHTHELQVLGAENKALNVTEELKHFKERVAVGLGVFPHHLGMTDGGNRAATDRLDVALYDKVKEYQKYLSEAIRTDFFNELLVEGGFDPFGLDSMEESEDMCIFRYNEIDVDTQIKQGTYAMSKLDRNVASVDETRRELGHTSPLNDEDTAADMAARIETKHAITLAKETPRPVAAGGSSTAKKAPAKKAAKPAANKRGSNAVIRPSNQHGTKTSPGIRHSTRIDFASDLDKSWLHDVESLLEEDELGD